MEKHSTLTRLKQYLDYKGISVRAFEQRIGFSNGSFASQLKNGKTIGVDRVENILNEFPDINAEWLLTGNGEMLKPAVEEPEKIFKTKTTENVTLSKGDLKGDLKGDFPKLQKTSPFDEDNSETKTTENAYNLNVGENVGLFVGKRKLQKTPTNLPTSGIASDVTVTYGAGGEDMMDSGRGISREEMIPVYDITMFLNLSKLLANEYRPTSYMYLPNLPKCDGATLMPGDSMEPEIKRGDVIVYRKVKNKHTGLFLGQIYLLSCELEGEVHVTVRYVLKSENEGYVQLASANEHYPPKDVPLEAIKELAMIKASVRYNTMV